MNYLALCQRAARECNYTLSASVPSTVIGQTGKLRKLVDWVATAHDELQGKHPNWKWMRSPFSVNTVAGTDSYAATACTDTRLGAPISRFSRWLHIDDSGYTNLKLYKQADGVGTERWVPYLGWSSFRALYKIGTQNNAPPAHFTIDPQNNLIFGPKPDAVYVASGEYQMSGLSLAVDADVPEIPIDHMLIVYLTMQKYGMDEAAVETFNAGALQGNRLMRQLELNQLPSIALAEPLA